MVFIDEIHVQTNPELVSVLEYGTLSRKQPLLVIMTTVSNHEDSLVWEYYEKSKAIEEGTITDPGYAYALYEAPEGDWKDPEVWKLANPSLGTRILEEHKLAGIVQKAVDQPIRQAKFEWQGLNRRIGSTHSWIHPDKWKALESDWMPPDGTTCWAGLDLSSKSDLTALGLIFKKPDDVGGGYHLVTRIWAPGREFERRHSNYDLSLIHI